MNADDEDELIEKRLELRQKLKSQLLTLSPSHDAFNSFHHFIPNGRDIDFLEKQGLDCVIDYLQSTLSSETQPTICSICRTDSTENWWSSFADNQHRCDQCEQIRRRHVILEQHRQSMKSAFLQAKENERRLEVNYHKQKKSL